LKNYLFKIAEVARQKLKRFAHNAEATNVIEPGKEIYKHIRGNWHHTYFQNQNPIVLELACGRGEYTTGLAMQHPEKNYIGVDIKGARLWKGSTTALENNLKNVAFLRAQIQNLDFFFAPQEVAEIWLIHPDPRPKENDDHRRLTHPRFLAMYRQLMQPEGWLHLKTDSEFLFDYTLEVLENQAIKNLQSTKDLYNSELNALHYGIKTTYEEIFVKQGYKINYLQFQFL
jgi:tRNA (guanine-N7-)-methyltransferase